MSVEYKNKKAEPIYVRDKRSPEPKNGKVSKTMSSNKDKNTSPEIILRKHLWEKGVRGYRLHKKDIVGRPDIVFTRKKVAIFVNGCFWHRCPYCRLPLPKNNQYFWSEKFKKNIQRDGRKRRRLNREGWKVITAWECQIKKDTEKVVSRILKRLG